MRETAPLQSTSLCRRHCVRARVAAARATAEDLNSEMSGSVNGIDMRQRMDTRELLVW
jgi:hypothetical protein